jgi:hypothetical protein
VSRLGLFRGSSGSLALLRRSPCFRTGRFWSSGLPLLPRHTCGTRRNTSILRRRGCLPRSRQTHRYAASVFRHRTSVPRLGGCSLSLAGSRPSGCFAGSASGSLMPVDSRCPGHGHALRWSSQGPILLRTLGSESTHPLSTLGTNHLSSRRSLPRCLASSGSSGSSGSLSSYLICLVVFWKLPHNIHLTNHFNFTILHCQQKYTVLLGHRPIWKRILFGVRTDNLFTRWRQNP